MKQDELHKEELKTTSRPERPRSYTLTTHTLEEVMTKMAQLGQPAPGDQVMYCDTQGVCLFDQPQPGYLSALEAILNEEANRGRRLVQLLFRERQMIAVWEERG